MKPKIDPSNIAGIECKHISYQPSNNGELHDLMVVKLVIHTKDNQQIHHVEFIEDFKRPVYITKPQYRNHEDKKEYEDLDKLQRYDTTYVEMPMKIQMALGRRVPDPRQNLRRVCQSPYVYYADFANAPYLRSLYRKKFPNTVSRNRVAVLDTERDVTFGTNQTVLTSVTMGKRRIVGVVKWWADRIPNFEETITAKYAEYLSDIQLKRTVVDEVTGEKEKKVVNVNLIEERGGDITFVIRDTAGEAIRDVMKMVHLDLNPDILAIWNMNYDIHEIVKMLRASNIDPATVFSHPDAPDQFKNFKYKEAKAQRETNSKTISQHPADLWHVVYAASAFYIIDAMCLFKKIRTAKGNEPDYNLDGILGRHLGAGKLKFSQADHLKKLAWHIFMQDKFPAEYVIYNLFDCISIELLDEETGDMNLTIISLAEISDYAIFPSLPKRLVDILHLFYEERGKIAGCVGSDITQPLDDEVISMTDWIVTLPAYAVERTGLFCIEEVPEQQTMMRRQTSDADILQAYPTGGSVLNISKETTFIEIYSIEGVSEDARRRAGINLTGGQTNAIEICNDILKMPFIEDVADAFLEDLKAGLV